MSSFFLQFLRSLRIVEQEDALIVLVVTSSFLMPVHDRIDVRIYSDALKQRKYRPQPRIICKVGDEKYHMERHIENPPLHGDGNELEALSLCGIISKHS